MNLNIRTDDGIKILSKTCSLYKFTVLINVTSNEIFFYSAHHTEQDIPNQDDIRKYLTLQ